MKTVFTYECPISIGKLIGSVVYIRGQRSWKEVWRPFLRRVAYRNKEYFILEKREVWR